MPEAEAVKLAPQVEIPRVTLATRVQGEPEKAPVALPVAVKPTVPDGVSLVPAAELSVTVAVQVDG